LSAKPVLEQENQKSKTIVSPRIIMTSRLRKRNVMTSRAHKKPTLASKDVLKPKIEEFEILAASAISRQSSVSKFSKFSRKSSRQNDPNNNIFSLTQGEYDKRPHTSNSKTLKFNRFKSIPIGLLYSQSA
jgi:hypothetical protein